MANALKEYENTKTKKVVVVKSNDFFSFKKVDPYPKEMIDDLKKTLTPKNISIISKVQTENSAKSVPPQPSGSRLSILKKHIVPSNIQTETAVRRTYKKKVPIVKHALEKKSFAHYSNLSRVGRVDGASSQEKSTKNHTIIPNDDLDEEKVMELVNMKYGDLLEAQIPFFQQKTVSKDITTPLYVDTTPKTPHGIKIVRNPISKLPSDIYDYKLNEERFLEEIDKEQNTSEHNKLETILLSDSPEDNCKLFTREELKKLPDKIFESPNASTIKQEISPVKEEKQEKQSNGLSGTALNFEENQDSFVSKSFENLLKTITLTSDNLLNNCNSNSIETKKTTESSTDLKKTGSEGIKTIWEELHDINIFIDQLQGDSKSNSVVSNKKEPFIDSGTEKNGILGKNKKEIVMASEDVIICKEIDKFIEETKMKNTSSNVIREPCDDKNVNLDVNSILKCPKDLSVSDSTESHTVTLRGNLNDTTLENPSELPVLQKSVPVIEIKTQTFVNTDSEIEITSTVNTEDTVNTEEASKSDTFGDTLKFVILEKPEEIERISEEVNDGNIRIEEPDDILETPVIHQKELQIEKPNEFKERSQFSDLSENNMTDNQKEDMAQVEIIVKVGDIVNLSDNQIDRYNFLQPNNYKEHTLLVLKENGFLEQINPDKKEENETSTSDNDFVIEGSSTTDIKINKEEILELLEQAQVIQYSPDLVNESKVNKGKLKSMSDLLREHIKIFIELFKKLESFTQLTAEELEKTSKTNYDCSILDNLNFIRQIVEKCFIKEKKPKYKVIKVTKKDTNEITTYLPESKPPLKKTYKTVPSKTTKKTSNKLLHHTLHRINKLLDTLEKKRKKNVSRNIRASKLKAKKVTKDNELTENFKLPVTPVNQTLLKLRCYPSAKKAKKVQNLANIGGNNSVDAETSNIDLCSSVTSFSTPDAKNKSLSVILERSQNVKEAEEDDSPNEVGGIFSNYETYNLSSFENAYQYLSKDVLNFKDNLTTSTPGSVTFDRKMAAVQPKKGSDDDFKENQPPTQNKQDEESTEIKRSDYLPRYCLRSGKPTNIRPSLDFTPKCKDSSTDKPRRSLAYEINFSNVITLNKNLSRTYDYVLRNDKNPCVVLYDKTNESRKSIFDDSATQCHETQNLPKKLKGKRVKELQDEPRYETRSRSFEKRRSETQMVLRSRKILLGDGFSLPFV